MLLSIITINYNNAAELKKTILSVIHQTWKEFEFIVIDGGSTDSSAEIIKKYEEHIQYWISEKDKGIYHAMNKGIAVAKAEYLFMLNSGDALANKHTLETVFKNDKQEADILYGNIAWMSKGVYVKESNFPKNLSFQYFWYKSLGHQSAFIRKSVHEKAGLYDEKLKFGSDWKMFVLAICRYNYTYKCLPYVVSNCDCNGLTWQSSNFPVMKLEKEKVLQNEFPLFYDDYKEFELIKKMMSRSKIDEFKMNIKKKIKKIIRYKKKK